MVPVRSRARSEQRRDAEGVVADAAAGDDVAGAHEAQLLLDREDGVEVSDRPDGAVERCRLAEAADDVADGVSLHLPAADCPHPALDFVAARLFAEGRRGDRGDLDGFFEYCFAAEVYCHVVAIIAPRHAKAIRLWLSTEDTLQIGRHNRRDGNDRSGARASQLFGQSFTGLSAAEVEERRARGEVNQAADETSRTYTRIVIDNALPPVNIALFAISIVLLALGLVGDALLTAGLVLGNVFVGVFQEARAKRQLDQIALLVRPKATVIRDGQEVDLVPDEIVKDDLLVLRPGDQIQTDGEVLGEEGFSVDEAMLTGESDLVNKAPGDKVYSATYAMTGSAVYKTTGVGSGRVAQGITAQARAYRNVRTPLQREVQWLIIGMGVLMLLLGIEVLNSLHRLYGGVPLVEGARAAAVIVALVPQGLWFMITVTYSLAILKVARTGALIQRMNAIESMSHVDTLCFDKTGTLTTNSLVLEHLQPIGSGRGGVQEAARPLRRQRLRQQQDE